ncbi:MAG: tRNA lysidine(34) synthetase TilS [Pseudomonadota bacterium]
MDNAALSRICAGQKTIALAVSGGSDSTALLCHISPWARAAGLSVHVYTVDHQLRPESADEAVHVGKLANSLGWHHDTLIWTTPRKSQAAARDARLRLLSRAAQRSGAGILMTGHTRDDVAETMWMRKARGAAELNWVGPLPVSASPVWPEGRNLTIVRPLLATRRKALRQMLAGAGQSWRDDPSNQDDRFERVRARRAIGSQDGPGDENLLMRMQRRADHNRRLSADLQNAAVTGDGLITLNAQRLDTKSLRETLAVLIRIASGTDKTPGRDNVAAVFTMTGRTTLGGAWIKRRGHVFELGRDPGLANRRWTGGLWDGRYEQAAGIDRPEEIAFILRESAPQGKGWREIVSERLQHEIDCLAASGEIATPITRINGAARATPA